VGSTIIEIDHYRDLLEVLQGLLLCVPVTVDDHRRVDLLRHQLHRLLEELTREDHDGRRAVADLVVLSLRDLDHHLRRWVLDIHLLQHRRAVVGDSDVAEAVHQHLVHPLRSEGGLHHLRHDAGRLYVRVSGVASPAAFGSFPENYDGLT
jgi:hypothetical protein